MKLSRICNLGILLLLVQISSVQALPIFQNLVLVSAVLPSSRSVTVGTTATAFATIINADSSNATGCRITPITSVAADFFFQTTDPATNALTGTRDASVDIAPGAAQTFVFGFTPTAAFGSTDIHLQYSCTNANDASVVTGLNTLLLSASNTPTADIVALVATVKNDGVVHLSDITDTGAFAVASVNVGASDSLMVSVDTGSATLPIVTSICETDPATSVCINPTTPTTGDVSLTIDANATPTFAVFVQGSEDVAVDPANKRVFVRFKDASGVTRGSTNVAIDSVPDIIGTFTGTIDSTFTNCQDPDNNGTDVGGLTLSIQNQSGSSFSGTNTSVETEDGITTTEVITITGTVDASGVVSGSGTNEVFESGFDDAVITFTFSGQLTGNTLTVAVSGQVTTGETCILTGSFTGTR